MSRQSTLAEAAWRVRVARPDSVITHESSFASLETARDYFDSLSFPGCDKTIEMRAAGKSRYVRVVLETMPRLLS